MSVVLGEGMVLLVFRIEDEEELRMLRIRAIDARPAATKGS